MRSRWDMHDAPPDILITNNSMLSVMLNRTIDEPIFAQTRDWLENNPDAVFHLIIDELHLYRGTAGTEVCELLRILLFRLGLHPGHPKLRILASSASLVHDAKSLEYLHDFFGVDWANEEVIKGTEIPLPAQPVGSLPSSGFRALSKLFVGFDEPSELEIRKACASLDPAIANADSNDWLKKVYSFLKTGTSNPGARLIRACLQGAGESEKLSAVPFSSFAKSLFPDLDSDEAAEAARGLLIARGLCDDLGTSVKLPQFRFHWFFRNLEGLWV